jgi:hypothetical protein
MLAVMRNASVGRPQGADQFKTLFENALVVLERNTERRIFATVVAASNRKIDAAFAQEIKRGPLFGDAARPGCWGLAKLSGTKGM